MIRMFITDLDGTLLNKWHSSDKVINQGVTTLKQRGYRFAVATGRHLRNHHRFGLYFLKQTDYFITMNGALVQDATGTVIFEQPIQSAKVFEILTTFNTISFELLTAQQTLVVQPRFKHFVKGFVNHFSSKNFGRALLNLLCGQYQYQVNTEQLQEAAILKMECMVESLTQRAQLIEYLENNAHFFSYAYNDEVHFEITACNVNKREGVLQLLKYLAVHPDRVAVYGNDRNDVEMLKYFVHSYAPANANETALLAAKYTIGSSNEHSVIQHMLETSKRQNLYK